MLLLTDTNIFYKSTPVNHKSSSHHSSYKPAATMDGQNGYLTLVWHGLFIELYEFNNFLPKSIFSNLIFAVLALWFIFDRKNYLYTFIEAILYSTHNNRKLWTLLLLAVRFCFINHPPASQMCGETIQCQWEQYEQISWSRVNTNLIQNTQPEKRCIYYIWMVVDRNTCLLNIWVGQL